MRLFASAPFPGFYTCLILSITTALLLVWTLTNFECSFAKEGPYCLRKGDDRSIKGKDISDGMELPSTTSTLSAVKGGALRLSATLDAVRVQNEQEMLLMESNSILERRTMDLERDFAPERHLKSSKGDKSGGKGGKGGKSDKSNKKSKKSKRKSYEDDDFFVFDDTDTDTNSTMYNTKSRKSSKNMFQDSSDSKKPDRVFVVILSDFSEASATRVIETFGTSEIMDKDITLLLTVPSDTDIYLIEGIVVTNRRHRNLIAASDFTCPPSSYDKHVKDASGKLFFRIPGDENSVTVFCDDDENVIGIYVHVVIEDGEDASPGTTPAPVATPSPTVAQPSSEEPTEIVDDASPAPTVVVDVTPVPTVETNVTIAPTVSTGAAVTPDPTAAVVATPAPTVIAVDVTPAPTENITIAPTELDLNDTALVI